MDKGTLLKEQIDAGETLIRKAQVCGLELTGGAWAHINGDGKPSPGDGLAKGIANYHRQYPHEYPSWHTNGMLGGGYADCAYIYPATLFDKPPAAAE